MFRPAFLASLLVVGLILIEPSQATIGSNVDIVNSKVDRTIDIATHLVKISLSLLVSNKGKVPVDEYVVHFGDKRHDETLSYVEAFMLNPVSKKREPLRLTKENDGDLTAYKLHLEPNSRLEPSKSIQLEVEAVFTHLVRPYPDEITQSDRQLVVYNGRIYLPSQYATETQFTRVYLPTSSGLESYTKLKPFSHTDRTITYGPYEKISPNVDSPITPEQVLKVHTENQTPFLATTNLERSIHVSHWAGTVSIEEILDVLHVGAKLKGAFSRYEYQRDSNLVSYSIKGWRTKLPAGAHDIYYRDEIGNISTSNVHNTRESVMVDLRSRFPLFGGWKTQYTLGYTLPSNKYLFTLDGSTFTTAEYKLRIPFVDHIYDNMVIDKATVKVILPEGASNFRLKLPYDIKREKNEVYYSYLDTIGRPVIVLSKQNLVSWHIKDIEITYSFKPFYLLQEPLLLTGSIFALCLLVIGLVRSKFSLDEK